jgi:hypothetical protein
MGRMKGKRWAKKSFASLSKTSQKDILIHLYLLMQIVKHFYKSAELMYLNTK